MGLASAQQAYVRCPSSNTKISSLVRFSSTTSAVLAVAFLCSRLLWYSLIETTITTMTTKCSSFGFSPLNGNTLLKVFGICTQSDPYHEFALRHAGSIFCLGSAPIHILHATGPRVRVKWLTNKRTNSTELLTPFRLHVELNISTLLKISNGLEERVIEFEKLTSLFHVKAADLALIRSRALRSSSFS
jgi:hypothetical protein